MPMSPRTVALLGAGYIADWHVQALRGVPGVRLAAVCDRDAGRARRFADRHGIPATFSDLADLLVVAKPDVVHILVPPEHHHAAAEAVLRAGVDAFVEKPLALTAAECRQLDALARQNGRAIGVGHNYLFAPVYEQLRADVRSGKLGRLDQVTITWHKELGQLRGGPFGGWLFREPANILLEVGPHPVAHLLDLVGVPDRLAAEADRPVELPNGVTVCRRWKVRAPHGETVVDLSLSLEPGFTEHAIHVRGTAGSATADLENGTYVVRRPGASGLDDYECWAVTARAGKSLVRQARATFARYVLSKFRLSRHGSLFGTSIARAIECFYTDRPDERISATFASRVVDVCQQIAEPSRLRLSGPPPTPTRARPTAPDTLVLGGTGFIGQSLVRRLVAAGRSVRLLVRDPAGLPRALQELPLDVVRGDLTDAATVDGAVAGVRDVFHLARGAGKTWDEYVRTDVEPTERVAAACRKHGVRRLIYTSTIAVYDESRSGEVITEQTALDPRLHRRDLYARAKGESERRLLEQHSRGGLPVVIVRPGIVVGPGASPFHWGVAAWPAPYVCRHWGQGDNPLPLVLVDDVARALMRVGELDGIEGESFNLAAETDLTARAYIAALSRATGTWIDARPRPAWRSYGWELTKYLVKWLVRHPTRRRPLYRDWKTRAHYARFDCAKAKRVLGWQPVQDRETLLREGVELPAEEWLR
jgi:predicted dehydrogenase/nucleoside-diphosphate-sugar epimerase